MPSDYHTLKLSKEEFVELERRRKAHQEDQKRSAAADVPDLIDLAKKIIKYGKLLEKKGF